MPDRDPAAAPSAADAAVAVAKLEAMAADLRGCAILDPGGSLLAASGAPEPWEEAARTLLAAADAAAGQGVSQVHVGTEDGEVFAVRLDGYAVVAATERFALASLTLFDMRSVLRELVREAAAPATPLTRAA